MIPGRFEISFDLFGVPVRAHEFLLVALFAMLVVFRLLEGPLSRPQNGNVPTIFSALFIYAALSLIWLVSLGNGKLKIKFTGTCTTINVGSGENTLDIESVDTLNVGGGKNKITIGTVDTIHLGGAKNVVRWKKAKTGDKPTIQDGAAGNDVAQAK